MKGLFILVLTFVVLSFSHSCDNGELSNSDTKIDHAGNVIKYQNLVAGLRNNYVLYYRQLQNQGIDLSKWGVQNSDSIFSIDSTRYADSYREFFLQNRDFIEWLLSFRNDSAITQLWYLSQSPLSSQFSECSWVDFTNSSAAIVLLENFLNGDRIECLGCDLSERKECNAKKYSEIEEFLEANSDKDIAGLRTAWKKKNDR